MCSTLLKEIHKLLLVVFAVERNARIESICKACLDDRNATQCVVSMVI